MNASINTKLACAAAAVMTTFAVFVAVLSAFNIDAPVQASVQAQATPTSSVVR